MACDVPMHVLFQASRQHDIWRMSKGFTILLVEEMVNLYGSLKKEVQHWEDLV